MYDCEVIPTIIVFGVNDVVGKRSKERNTQAMLINLLIDSLRMTAEVPDCWRSFPTCPYSVVDIGIVKSDGLCS